MSMLTETRTSLTTLALLAVWTLAACSADPTPGMPKPSSRSDSSSASDEKVATLREDLGSAPSSDAPSNDQARERLDMTEAERTHLYDVYAACMKDHDVDLSTERALEGREGQSPRITDALAACQNKRPLPPWELDPQNPKAIAFGRSVVACLREKGVEYVDLEVGTEMVMLSFGRPGDDSGSVSKGLELTPECQREVANQ